MTDKEIFEYWFDYVRPKLLPDYKNRIYNDYIEFAKHYHQAKSTDLADDVGSCNHNFNRVSDCQVKCDKCGEDYIA